MSDGKAGSDKPKSDETNEPDPAGETYDEGGGTVTELDEAKPAATPAGKPQG